MAVIIFCIIGFIMGFWGCYLFKVINNKNSAGCLYIEKDGETPNIYMQMWVKPDELRKMKSANMEILTISPNSR